jgi:hypothetical protein
VPGFTRSDAVPLAALVILGGPQRQALDVLEIVREAESLNASSVDFDQVSHGLPRLVAGGFALVGTNSDGTLTVSPTRSATALVRPGLRSRELVDVAATALSTRPYPEAEAEDRSRGRLTGLDEDEFDLAAHRGARGAIRSLRRSWRRSSRFATNSCDLADGRSRTRAGGLTATRPGILLVRASTGTA